MLAKVWSRQAWLQRPRHGHQVRLTAGDDLLRDVRGVDAVGRDHRDTDGLLEPGREVDERGPRHGGDDGGDAGLVPADAGVEHVDTNGLEALREFGGLLPRLAAVDQVEQADPVLQQEVAAHLGADAAHDLLSEPHPPARGAAPRVGAVVGPGGEELVDEVALRAHDLDAVIPRAPGQAGGPDPVVDRPLDTPGAQGARSEHADRRLGRRGRADERLVSVAAGVEDLQEDVGALGMDGVGEAAVLVGHPARGHHRPGRQQPPLHVGRVPAGDHEGGPAARPLGEVGGELGQVLRAVLQPGVHGPHDHAVAQGEMPDGEGTEEVRVTVAHGG